MYSSSPIEYNYSASGNINAESSYFAKFSSSNKNTWIKSFRVVGHCVGSAIFAPIFVGVIAAAAAIVAVLVIAAVVAFLLGVFVVVVLPPIGVFGGALLRIDIFRRYCFCCLFRSDFPTARWIPPSRRRPIIRVAKPLRVPGPDQTLALRADPLISILVCHTESVRHLKIGAPDPLTTASSSSIKLTTGSKPFRPLEDRFVNGRVSRTQGVSNPNLVFPDILQSVSHLYTTTGALSDQIKAQSITFGAQFDAPFDRIVAKSVAFVAGFDRVNYLERERKNRQDTFISCQSPTSIDRAHCTEHSKSTEIESGTFWPPTYFEIKWAIRGTPFSKPQTTQPLRTEKVKLSIEAGPV